MSESAGWTGVGDPENIPTDLVSVIVPTIGRPSLALAVQSILNQSSGNVEVIVVNDGARPIELPSDPRLRVVRSGPNGGGNVARMVGVRSAKGRVLAFLDDDDTWVKDKLSVQLSAVKAELNRNPSDVWIASGRVRMEGKSVWPKHIITADTNITSYLFRHRLRAGGQGALHTSTLIFPRALIEEVPLRQDLRFHQDTTWMIDLEKKFGKSLPVVQVADVVCEARDTPGSVSARISAAQSIQWARRFLPPRPSRSSADFLLTVSLRYALRQKNYSGAARAIFAAFTYGMPHTGNLLNAIVALVRSVR